MSKLRPISTCSTDQGFWFRVFGYGLSFRDTTKTKPPFSERIGAIKSVKIGKYAITRISPWKEPRERPFVAENMPSHCKNIVGIGHAISYEGTSEKSLGDNLSQPLIRSDFPAPIADLKADE